MHIAEQCFSNFGVSLLFPHNSVYAKLFNELILQFAASGLDLKIANDMAWDLQRSDTQKLLDSTKSKSFSMADVEERKLNLADTEGMFLLMGIGYVLAGSVLFSEIVGGCANKCRAFIRRNAGSGSGSRRQSVISLNHSEQSQTFSEKLKRNLIRRLRSNAKSKKAKEEKELEESQKKNELDKPSEANESGETIEPALKGPMSFCTLKRIMLMRKQRKDAKKEVQGDGNVADVGKENAEEQLENGCEVELKKGDADAEHVTIRNEKSGDFGDGASFHGSSSSIYSDTHIIKEETEAEVNHLPVSTDRENNPSNEFGEVV